MSWTKSEDIDRRGQDLEEISRFLDSEIPSIGYICDSVKKADLRDTLNASY